MARFGAILTNYGNAAITRAFLSGTMVNVTKFALGDGGGSPYTPTPDMTGLRGETWRTAVSHGEIDPDKPNEVVFYATLPPELDLGYIREMAVFDDSGYMVAIANTPEIQKVSFDEGAGLDAVLSMAVEVVHAEVIKYEVDPYTIIATRHDLDEHNASTTAHQDIRDELAGKADIGTPDMYPVVLPSGLVNASAYGGAYYYKTAENRVHVQMSVRKSSGEIFAHGESILILPEGFRPADNASLAAIAVADRYPTTGVRYLYPITYKGGGVFAITNTAVNSTMTNAYMIHADFSFLASQ